MLSHPLSINEFFKLALDERKPDDNVWLFWRNFNQIIHASCDINQLIDVGFSLITDKPYCYDNEQFIFQLILILTLGESRSNAWFEKLFAFKENQPELAEIWTNVCYTEWSGWRRHNSVRKRETEFEHHKTTQKNRENFDENRELIQNGQHFGWLGFLAKVYFSRFSGLNREHSPPQRLVHILGEERADIALQALRTLIDRNDLPTPSDIANVYSNAKFYEWWYAILAGVSESWIIKPSFQSIPERALKAALAINLIFPSYYKYDGKNQRQAIPDWQSALFKHRPELVQEVYLDVIQTLLATKKKGHIPGIDEICSNADLDLNRGIVLIQLLRDYPNAPADTVNELLVSSIRLSQNHAQLLELVTQNIQLKTRLRLHQKELWLCAGIVLSLKNYREICDWYAHRKPGFIWTLIDFINDVDHSVSRKNCDLVSPGHRAFFISLAGAFYPNIEHPSGTTWENRNPWDAAAFVKSQITKLSIHTDSESVPLLNRLVMQPELESYREYLKNAAANQSALRRKEIFERPGWQPTIRALTNSKPANIADFHALTIEHLRDIANRIRTENTDSYKGFWNEDSHGRITAPKPEESCRDRLIDQFSPKFIPLEINVEPEGHMAADKRADIVLLSAAKLKLSVEIKRDYHADLWTACENQLDRLYTRDPQSQGYGIYLVFWFGEQRGKSLPKPPNGINRPVSANQLENALQMLIKEGDRYRLAVIVIDVERPD